MKKVTDQELLRQLEGDTSTLGKRVTDPELLAQLDGSLTPTESTGFGQKAIDIAMHGGGIPGNPVDVAQKVYKGVAKAFDRGGELTAENLGGSGIDPRIAAAVGTTISMVPDLASSYTPAGPGVKGIKALEPAAQGFARRALGFSKRQLGNDFARGQAAKAAKVALQQDILPFLGNRDIMAERATNFINKSGEKIGKMRDAAGRQSVDTVFNSLEELRGELVKGRKGGIWDTISNKIDAAGESILGLADESWTVSLRDVEETKNLLRESLNYDREAAAQKLPKKITSAIERGVERTIGKTGGDVKAYRAEKEKFGAGKKMLEGINNARSAEEGNNLVGPIASISGIAQAASGNLPGAAASLGIIELLKRRGSSGVANLLDLLDKGGRRIVTSGRVDSPLMALISQLSLNPPYDSQ